ncbi:hypothetical protein [Winogradskyella luteola]|uniref:Uncharacterized protein n=1 Tax=Winogradskyella luteola TaxID=2828330 RepID=A0A9X1JPL4_9FLAO|nr:hypothetical protein [Winogradskyella luteola]MBV7268028.1 hypothetical protein [Winogradskyella luteola]
MKFFHLLISLTLILTSCKSDEDETKGKSITIEEETIKLSPKRPNLNISILLDLSDRINPKKYPNPAMEYFERDLGYIHSIAKSFEWHVRNKRSIKINDHIQLYIDPEPSDSNLNEKINSLNITFTKNNAKRELIMKTSALYDSISKQIYNSAIEDNNYVGSDIWGFFKTNVEDFCIQENYRNILVILTDGYLYHKYSKLKEGNLTSYLTPQNIRSFQLNKLDWEDKIKNKNFGFIATRDNLEELEVLVLGINPDSKNPYEQDVILRYWTDWLTKMNVKDFEIKTASLPANMDKIIKEYIFKE